MIRHDKISKMLIVLAMMLTVYLSTFENSNLIMFPGLLLTFGLVMEWFMEKKREDISDQTMTTAGWKEIGVYTILSLFGIFLVGYGTTKLPFAIFVGFSALAYGALMAIAEEQFFRGFITELCLARIKRPILALLTSGFTFTIYHIARYGTEPDAMIYVFAGGLILSWSAYRSRRFSPGMLAHIVNNLRAAALGG